MLTNCTILNALLLLMNSRLTMLNYLPTLSFGCEIDILNICKTELNFPFNNLISWSFLPQQIANPFFEFFWGIIIIGKKKKVYFILNLSFIL